MIAYSSAKAKVEQLATLSHRVEVNAKLGTPEALKSCLDDRRAIAELMTGLRVDCDTMIDALPAAVQSSSREELRVLFNRLRSSLALLQAEWPVVEIARNPEGYDRAKQSFNRDERAFINWVAEISAGKISGS